MLGAPLNQIAQLSGASHDKAMQGDRRPVSRRAGPTLRFQPLAAIHFSISDASLPLTLRVILCKPSSYLYQSCGVCMDEGDVQARDARVVVSFHCATGQVFPSPGVPTG